MDKKTAEQLKKVINKDKHYQTNFQNKTNELRVRVYTWTCECDKDETKENNAILTVLNKLTENGLRPSYRIERRVYQGFIHDTNIIFS